VSFLVEKATGYGIPGAQADGNDVLAVYETTRVAVDRARRGEGPTLVELITYRRKGHAEHDDQSYVPKEEIAEWERKDPIDRYVRRLTESGWATAGELAAVDARVEREIDRAVALCENEPLPEPATALERVYADPPVAPLEWYRNLDD
jgi:pyruvate dehydrogenase E1 component alpha subunit/2-oxoisovalerate dehydrogenase E1 component alpha subunit